jgi:hypothetical protein
MNAIVIMIVGAGCMPFLPPSREVMVAMAMEEAKQSLQELLIPRFELPLDLAALNSAQPGLEMLKWESQARDYLTLNPMALATTARPAIPTISHSGWP